MKICRLICFVIIFILAFFCIFQAIRKETIYIAFEDLNGYKYQFNDTIDFLKTKEILITQTGEHWYQWWNIEVDTEKITKTDVTNIRKIIIDSQYFIIGNYFPGKKIDILKMYNINIIRWKNDVPYILPIKDIKWIEK